MKDSAFNVDDHGICAEEREVEHRICPFVVWRSVPLTSRSRAGSSRDMAQYGLRKATIDADVLTRDITG
jgi:hypothetical protein